MRIQTLILTILRFCPNLHKSTKVSEIIEYIGEAISLMSSESTSITGNQRFDFTDHILELPCYIQQVIKILYEGQPLNLGTSVLNTADTRDSFLHNNQYGIAPYGTMVSPTAFEFTGFEKGLGLYEPITTKNVLGSRYYNVEVGNLVKFSFPEGCVDVHYKGNPVDSEGYPFVIDNEEYKNGIIYHTLSRLILTGYQHPTLSFKDANELARRHLDIGAVAVRKFTPEMAQSSVALQSTLFFNANASVEMFLNYQNTKLINL